MGKLIIIFSSISTFLISFLNSIFTLGVCHRSIDIAFVVDGSTEKSDFAKFIDFIAAVIGKLPISEFGSRVALLTFGDKGELKFGFDK